MSGSVKKNTYVGIPPIVDDRILAPAVRALVENVELLTGQRGDKSLAVPVDFAAWVRSVEARLKALEGP